jgi:hypothetical protein
MKAITFSLIAAATLGSLSVHAAEFNRNCYAEAEAVAVRYVEAKYRSMNVRGGQAMDGEGDDIRIQVQVNGRTLCVDVGVEQEGNACAVSRGEPQVLDCNE